MIELPHDRPIPVRPGAVYEGLAIVKDSHSEQDMRAKLEGYGLSVDRWTESASGQRGYHRVNFRVTAGPNASGSMPWSLPSPLKWVDKSYVVRASMIDSTDVESTPLDRRVDRMEDRLTPKWSDWPNEHCQVCRNFAWDASLMKPVKGADGWHHPSCPSLGQNAMHRCSSASSSVIAKQIDPSYTYSHSMEPNEDIRCHMETREFDVTTPEGQKRVPARFCGDLMILRCPYTGQQFVFTKASTGAGAIVPYRPRRQFDAVSEGTKAFRMGAGDAGSGTLSLSDILKSPEGQSAWNQIQAQVNAESNDPLAIPAAEKTFVDEFNGLLNNVPSIQTPSDAIFPARDLTLAKNTIAGAVQTVNALASAAQSGDVGQMINVFTGVMVSLAVGFGATTAGVGAAIVGGVELGVSLLENAGLIPEPPPPGQALPGCAGVTYHGPLPDIMLNCIVGNDATGGGSHARVSKVNSLGWRNFPNPNSSADAWWFDKAGAQASTWKGVNWTNYTRSPGFTSMRPVDVAFPHYVQVLGEIANPPPGFTLKDLGLIDAMVFLAFNQAFLSALMSNWAYALNGLQPQPDEMVLLQTLRFYNKAHDSRGSQDLVIQQSGQGSPYFAQLVEAMQAKVSPDDIKAGVVDNSGNIIIHSGNQKHPPLLMGPVHLVGPRLSGGGGTSIRTAAKNTTVAALMATAGIGAYAFAQGMALSLAYGTAWRAVKHGLSWLTAERGSFSDVSLPIVGASETKKRRRRRR